MGEMERSSMKRELLVVFALCSISLLMCTEMAIAYNPAYPTTIYSGTAPTIDGTWTPRTMAEWIDAATPAGIPASFTFRDKYSVAFVGGALKVYENSLIEFFTDNTNDAGDYVQICYDNNATGAAAPKPGDLRIDIIGHSGTVVTYNGTGTGWAPVNISSSIVVAQTLSASPLSSTPHWITEFQIEKQSVSLQMVNAIRIAVYDASNPSAGVKAFPPASQQDVPSGWSQVLVGTGTFLPAVQARAFTNVAVIPGWTWYFFVQGTGGVGALKYQWYDAAGPIAGQASMVLPVTKNAPGTYQFFCNVTDSVGQTVNSNNVTLTVFT
jgi:hypothetical protein